MFKKYNSIENTYREEFLNRIQGHGFWNDEYVVQEKVHGANLSFWTTDGVTFQAGKRTARLGETEKFYNFRSVLVKLQPKLENIWKALQKIRPDLTQLTIFGELSCTLYLTLIFLMIFENLFLLLIFFCCCY